MYAFRSILIVLIILTHGHQRLQETLASPASKPVDGDTHQTMRYYHVNLDGHNNRHVPGDRAVFDNGGGDQQLAGAPKGRRIAKRAARGALRDSGNEDTVASGQDYDDYELRQQLNDDFLSFHPRKRTFSVLARWKPFTNISKLRLSNRQQQQQQQQQQQLLRSAMVQKAHAQQMLSSADDYDVISAETRALLLRPSGQPLRWG